MRYVAARIRRVQDLLERTIAIEQVSYYAAPGGTAGQRLCEAEFINAVLAEADCQLLLDVNNVYVNSINFRYDPYEFIDALDLSRTAYLHIAGHYVEAEDLRIDTHGAAVIDPVWALLGATYARTGPLPTLLERDFNFPPMRELLGEIACIRHAQASVGTRAAGRVS